jgi:hypothetical protein
VLAIICIGGKVNKIIAKNNAHSLLILNILSHLNNNNELKEKTAIVAIFTYLAPDKYSVKSSE